VYEWRTGADRVREVAAAYVAGRLTVRRAVAKLDGDYLERVLQWLEMDVDEATDEELADLLPQMAEVPGPAVSDGALSFYDFEDDAFFGDVASALDFPGWARRERVGDGGPGSGYERAVIVLEGGHTLWDLGEWLRGR